MARTKLARLKIRGFKGIADLDFEPFDLNVMIGPNGAGKSNFIGFFRFLSWMLGGPTGNLQEHIAYLGGANVILHDGAEKTREIEAEVQLATDVGTNDYAFRLFYAAGDTLVFAEEKSRFSRFDKRTTANWSQHGSAGHKEAKIVEAPGKTAQTILALLRGLTVFQFHNTSHTSRMRTRWSINDARYLKEDGGNLGAFLYYTRENYPKHYTRIVRYLQGLLPFFDDFVLDPEHDRILLRWREKQCDMNFDASLASDGMLRTMALIALLCQPQDRLPDVIFFDEPELGLHPAAINLVSGLMKSVSRGTQVFVATQSTDFLDTFEPEDIVVVERKDRDSTYRRLNAELLEEWLEEYSLGELWAKNVIGGKP